VARFRSEGYRKFQLKAGGEPDEDIQRIRAALEVLEPGDILVADANRGWLMPQALRVVNAVVGKNVYIEQPCRTLEECLVVRNHTDLPLVLDEIVINVEALVNAWGQRALDILNIKFSRSGGLTKSKLLRDMCQAFGIIMTIEDCWGGDITTATIAHLAGSTRPEFLFTATDFNSYIDLEVAPDAPRREAGKLPVPTAPGLGIHVDEKVLGDPVVSIR
jgi:L-alanine-DL-glutamate epimerase-like enolase superfamily enzyme